MGLKKAYCRVYQWIYNIGMKVVKWKEPERLEGVEKLTGAPIQAYDLRAGAALVIAALAAEGESEISNVQYIERGYEDIIGKLRALGADIRAVEEPDEDALSTAQIS